MVSLKIKRKRKYSRRTNKNRRNNTKKKYRRKNKTRKNMIKHKMKGGAQSVVEIEGYIIVFTYDEATYNTKSRGDPGKIIKNMWVKVQTGRKPMDISRYITSLQNKTWRDKGPLAFITSVQLTAVSDGAYASMDTFDQAALRSNKKSASESSSSSSSICPL